MKRLRAIDAIFATLLASLLLAAVAAPWISPQNPYDLAAVRLDDSNVAPVWMRTEAAPRATLFWLGADRNGRDMVSAVLYGLRVSVTVGAVGTLAALAAGTALGLFAGYFGGWGGAAIMRLADIQLAFPSVLIALFMMALWGPGMGKVIVAVAFVNWVVYARVARGQTLVEREKDYIAAERAMGAGRVRIIARHLAPNIAGPLMAVAAVQFASNVMLEATLSYLGLGAPETRPSLGMLIRFGYEDFFSGHWWVWLFPGSALVLLVLSVNALADRLRDRMRMEG